MVNRLKMSQQEILEAERLAKIFAKKRGQEGRGVSAKDMEKALEMIQNKNKKFMNGK